MNGLNPFLGRRKQLVEVVAYHRIDGSVDPMRIIMADGTTFDIDSFLDAHIITTLSPGVILQYPITIRKRETYLYESEGRWWVLIKE